MQRRHHQIGTAGQGQLQQLPTRGVHAAPHRRLHPGAGLGVQLLPPADAGGVVVGARVHHPAPAFDIRRQVGVGGVAIKGELEDLHARQLKAVPQGLHRRGDHAQVFRDDRQPTGLQLAGQQAAQPQQRQQGATGGGPPVAPLGGVVFAGHAPKSLQGPEVIQPEQIE